MKFYLMVCSYDDSKTKQAQKITTIVNQIPLFKNIMTVLLPTKPLNCLKKPVFQNYWCWGPVQ